MRTFSRLRTMVRYQRIFRLGILSYVTTIVLLLLVVWSYSSRVGSSLNKEQTNHRLAGGSPVQGGRGNLKVYTPSMFGELDPNRVRHNRSEPILAVPPVAVVTLKESLSAQCSIVRVVNYFGMKLVLSGSPLCQWLEKPTELADGRFYVYGNYMALLYDVIVDPIQRSPGRLGGEEIEEVWGQKEEDEYFALKNGFYTMQCKDRPSVHFKGKSHLNQWLEALQCMDNTTAVQTAAKIPGLTIAVQRYEYVNLYHTMTDYYNAFLTMLAFGQHPDDVTILWVDAHPKGGLDEVWGTLFGSVLRAGHLKAPTLFPAMAWSTQGYQSPLNDHKRPTVFFLEEFRYFFLSRHGLKDWRPLNCSSLNFFFIRRKAYVAHPRNKVGSISRKIDNEDELLAAIRKAIAPGDKLDALQLDALPMKQQLQWIADTDVLLGVHGAGLSHTLFLPQHAGLLEFYMTYSANPNRHFRVMAKWRGLQYQIWQNNDRQNEDPKTYIPVDEAVNMVKEMRRNICGVTKR